MIKKKKYVDKYGRVFTRGVRIKNVHSLAELREILRMAVLQVRFNRRIESLEHELAVEEIGVTREAIRSVMNEEMWGRPRKKGGNESTGERKDGKMLMKRERKLRAREFEEDEGYY